MKITVLSKLIIKEYYKYILISILLLIMNIFLYFFSKGIYHNSETLLFYWFGGYGNDRIGILEILLKVLNIAIIFLSIGRIIDKISESQMVYILARTTYYNKVIANFTFIIIAIGLALLILSHLLFIIIAGLPLNALGLLMNFLLLDCLSFIGIIIIYICLNNVLMLEHSIIYILVLYFINTIIAFPILIAMSTVQFLKLESELGIPNMYYLILGIDLLILFIYYLIIKKRKVNIC